MKHFRLFNLPAELVLEILRLAATPDARRRPGSPNTPELVYTNACALARVSYSVRGMVMPHLLHTILFSSQTTLHLFLRTLEQQNHFASRNHSLKIDYIKYVSRIWSSECMEPLVLGTSDRYRDYSSLYPFFTQANDIGLNQDSMHLLHEVLGGRFFTDHPPVWNCKRVTIAGDNFRWNAMTTTAPAHAFLSKITHLTLWSMEKGYQVASMSINSIPHWVHKVPFEHMPNLTNFAFTLDIFRPASEKMSVLVYRVPSALRGTEPGGKLVRKWLAAGDLAPLDQHAFVRYVDLHDPDVSLGMCWETAFLRGDDDIWKPPRSHTRNVHQARLHSSRG